ncbi:TonB-dependent receptor, partial [uncultured Enterobacter sp.]|uniref:TonB-dependent receptor n=1 Tax=uncultured Enterobacter sp. TaxID=238202 RepID=UPI00259634A8
PRPMCLVFNCPTFWGQYKVGLTGVSAQLNVNNLTDRSYVAACNSLSYCYFGAERSIVGSVSWKF